MQLPQLPLLTLLTKAGSWGPTWRQAGEVKEKVSPQSAGLGARPLPLLAAPQCLGFKSAQTRTGFIPFVMCIHYPSYTCTHTQEDGVTMPSVGECSGHAVLLPPGTILLAREK